MAHYVSTMPVLLYATVPVQHTQGNREKSIKKVIRRSHAKHAKRNRPQHLSEYYNEAWPGSNFFMPAMEDS